jgi:hypothetical protein
MVKYQVPHNFRDLDYKYHDQLSLNSYQVIGMHLFDNNVEIVAIFIHMGLKMTKMSFLLLFFMIKYQLPCSFWDVSS